MSSTIQARSFYEHTRGLSAFNMPTEAKFTGANQWGRRYTFPDGSTLRVDRAHDRIEWRVSPGSYGAVRGLFYRCLGEHRERAVGGAS